MHKTRSHTHIAITAILLFFLFAADAQSQWQAQSSQTATSMEVPNHAITLTKNTLQVDLQIKPHKIALPSDNQLVFTPALRSKDGTKERRMRPLIINGSRRNNLYLRSLNFNGIQTDELASEVVISTQKEVEEVTIYSDEIPYESWMNNADLYLIKDMSACCGEEYGHEELLILPKTKPEPTPAEAPSPAPAPSPSQAPSPPAPAPTPAPTRPKTDDGLRYITVDGAAYVYFNSGSAEIMPNLSNNAAELAKIAQNLQQVREVPGAVLVGMNIKAFASPVGDTKDNLELSERRAAELMAYVTEKYQFPANMRIVANGLGEDWTKFEALVKADSHVPNKQKVLEIIKLPSVSERKKRLKELDGGKSNQYFVDVVYPKIRRLEYKIQYTIPTTNSANTKK
ncbi:DUF3868 domain-containing protein [Candidatus Symbiothrix dinenymphae]|uniref:DUF3868 domain-containing protein n=1 Tax=Candidatus Symbiothrix dinenymphae TaxID=467085 RepID=UPI0006C66465|nr:DUF3868 domain-containing protein [Candidatus Symbiothrix dinenymphae]GAP72031.1 hypothetical protein SAMD00024442_22_23 [Candidatus Symbiothrix dinenymphae]